MFMPKSLLLTKIATFLQKITKNHLSTWEWLLCAPFATRPLWKCRLKGGTEEF